MCFAYPWISSVRNSFIRPVVGRGAGRAPALPPPPKKFSNLNQILLQKMKNLLKWTAVNES